MEIICKSCGLNSKNENDYVPRYDRKSSNKRRNICWVCHREESKSYRKKYRSKVRNIINSYKDVPCKDCGVKYPSYVMDFDHISDNKSFTVSDGSANQSIEKLITEIKKCEVVCANCHRIRTHKRK
jgi:hypothetical protein